MMGEYMIIGYKGYSIEVEHSVSMGFFYTVSDKDRIHASNIGFPEARLAVIDAKNWINNKEDLNG